MDDNDLLDYDETTDGLNTNPTNNSNDLNNNPEKSDKNVEISICASQSQAEVIHIEDKHVTVDTNNEEFINDDDDDDDFVPVVMGSAFNNENSLNGMKKNLREPSFLNEIVEIDDENEIDEGIIYDEFNFLSNLFSI